jgi:uncharacterized caspase-like protein
MKALFKHPVTGLALAVITPLALGGLAHAEESRFALVIGEDAYTEGALPTAANDAALVADTLKDAGFEVTGQRNLDQPALRTAMRDFIAKAREAGPDAVVAFYFSGYALQYAGENYLVPYGAKIDRDTDVPIEAVRVDDFIRSLGTLQLKARIVMLDAARNAPYAKSGAPLAGGLAMMEAPEGTLISFNTAPGSVAPDAKEGDQYGVYARAFGELAREGGATLDYVFARLRLRASELSAGSVIPWHVSKVTANFAFFQKQAEATEGQGESAAADDNQAAGGVTTAAPITVLASGARIDLLGSAPVDTSMTMDEAFAIVVARDTIADYEAFLVTWPESPLAERVKVLLAARREAITWLETRKRDTAPAYWSYLKRYPKGPHAEDARRRLAWLSAEYAPPPVFEEIVYDVPPPPAYEIIYVERPVIILYDPVWAPPPPPPVVIMPLPIWVAPPPPPPSWSAPFVLPIFVNALAQKAVWKPPVYVKLPPQPIIQKPLPLNQVLKPQPLQLGSKPQFQPVKLPPIDPSKLNQNQQQQQNQQQKPPIGPITTLPNNKLPVTPTATPDKIPPINPGLILTKPPLTVLPTEKKPLNPVLIPNQIQPIKPNVVTSKPPLFIPPVDKKPLNPVLIPNQIQPIKPNVVTSKPPLFIPPVDKKPLNPVLIPGNGRPPAQVFKETPRPVFIPPRETQVQIQKPAPQVQQVKPQFLQAAQQPIRRLCGGPGQPVCR